MWHETVARVVENVSHAMATLTSRILCQHCARAGPDMYELIFKMKFLPPGRGLWGILNRSQNSGKFKADDSCGSSLRSGEMLHTDVTLIFTFLMDASLLQCSSFVDPG